MCTLRKALGLSVLLAVVPAASASVRVFVTTSSDPYGLENDANHMIPTVSTVYSNGTNENAYDYWADYYGTIPGPIRPGGFPPSDAPSGTLDDPVVIAEGDFAYIWLQFQGEPESVKLNGLEITIRELGHTTPAAVPTTFYVCNNLSNIIYDKRWDGTATPPDYPEWHNNPQLMVAIAANGIDNVGLDRPWNLWEGASRIALLGAVEAPANRTTYEILITGISYWALPIPEVAGGVFLVGGVDPRTVPPGLDCWQIGCGRTQYNFRATPLPANFFDPGSAPYSKVVQLRGGQTADYDVLVERLHEMVFDTVPSTADSEIRVTYLELVGCEPIDVLTNGQPVAWDVEVGLSVFGPPPEGSMVVTRTYSNGGTYTAEFSVQPVFVFTRVDPPHDQRVFDTGLLGQPPLGFATMGAAPFVFELDPNGPAFPCDTDFAPGIEGQPGQPPQWRRVSHLSGPPGVQGHFLVFRPRVSIGSPTGTCQLRDGSRVTVESREECEALGGRWSDPGTDRRGPEAGLRADAPRTSGRGRSSD